MTRIIAGAARGVQLRVPPGERTRPTTDRVREAFFSALVTWVGGSDALPAEQLAGIRLLDLYAGSGAIGLEAASRGAAEVVLVESHRPAAETIRRNAATAKLNVQVRNTSVHTYLGGPPQPFDVVWADPPYALAASELDELLRQVSADWLAEDGLVIVERSSRDPAPTWPQNLTENWTRRYGETQLHFGRPPLIGDEENQ